jgi:hypothetical protein
MKEKQTRLFGDDEKLQANAHLSGETTYVVKTFGTAQLILVTVAQQESSEGRSKRQGVRKPVVLFPRHIPSQDLF